MKDYKGILDASLEWVNSHQAMLAKLEKIKTPFIQNNLLQNEQTWHALRLQHGEIQIYPESRGLFLPHRLGLQHTGHLNFNKGSWLSV